MVYTIYGLSALSIILLTCLLWALSKNQKLKKISLDKDNTRDASELLSKLLSGGAVVVTQIIDPNDILLHSPRDRS